MVVDAGTNHVGRIENCRVPFTTPKEDGSVAQRDQGQIDRAGGGALKRVLKLRNVREACNCVRIPWRGRRRGPRWTGWPWWWSWSGGHACL